MNETTENNDTPSPRRIVINAMLTEAQLGLLFDHLEGYGINTDDDAGQVTIEDV